MFDKSKRFRDIVDEVDRIFDTMEKEMEDMMKHVYESSSKLLDHPFVYGFSVRMGPEGEPIVRTFGDRSTSEQTFREPVYDQLINEEKGELKVLVELPGVDKEDIQLKSSEEDLTISARRGERIYSTNIKLNSPVESETASASYRTGILEVTFKLRGKANKGYTKINVE